MPPRKRAAAAAVDNAASKKADADAKLAALVEELDVEVESKCQMLQSEAERLAKTIRSEYAVQIQKLPKKVREMTVAEFFTQNAAYAKDLETDDLKALAAEFASTTAAAPPKEVEGMPTRTPFKVVQNQNGSQTVLRSTRLQSKFASVNSAVKRKPDEEEVFTAPRTTRRMTKNSQVLATPAGKGSAAVAQTPMLRPDLPCTPANNQHGGLGLAPPGTSLRLPKRGESIMSARGSPGKVLTSDAKAQMIVDGNNQIAAFAMGTGRGDETINLANPDEVSVMSKSIKLKAAENVLAMQKQLEQMLESLRT